jgi:hypothetical protein
LAKSISGSGAVITLSHFWFGVSVEPSSSRMPAEAKNPLASGAGGLLSLLLLNLAFQLRP